MRLAHEAAAYIGTLFGVRRHTPNHKDNSNPHQQYSDDISLQKGLAVIFSVFFAA